MIAEISDILLNELKDYYDGSGVVVEDYPNDPDQYTLRAEGAVLVRFFGIAYGEPDSQESVRQVGQVQFQVVTVARNKRTHTGCYQMLDAVRNEVLGLEYREQRFAAVSEELLGESSGIWYYSQVFGIRQRVRQQN